MEVLNQDMASVCVFHIEESYSPLRNHEAPQLICQCSKDVNIQEFAGFIKNSIKHHSSLNLKKKQRAKKCFTMKIKIQDENTF